MEAGTQEIHHVIQAILEHYVNLVIFMEQEVMVHIPFHQVINVELVVEQQR